jgi:hypothetical protein
LPAAPSPLGCRVHPRAIHQYTVAILSPPRPATAQPRHGQPCRRFSVQSLLPTTTSNAQKWWREMVRDLAMPGGGAATKVSRTNQFVPEIGRGRRSLAASSTVAILSTALLCGLSGRAMSQTQLPGVTVVAPKQVARPHRRLTKRPQAANAVASRPISSPAQTTAPAQGSVMARLAAIERTSSNCTDGCQTSFKYGNQPWNGCSGSSGDFTLSTTCRNVRNFKTYQECRETGMFLAWRQYEVWWYCSSLHAGGKLSGEKQLEVTELKRSGRR